MLHTSVKHRRQRSQRDPRNSPFGVDAVATLSLDSGVVVLSLSLPVVLKGVPQVLVEGVAPVSATQSTPTTIRLTYAAPAVSTDGYTVPSKDPACRTANGGFVQPVSGVFP